MDAGEVGPCRTTYGPAPVPRARLAALGITGLAVKRYAHATASNTSGGTRCRGRRVGCGDVATGGQASHALLQA